MKALIITGGSIDIEFSRNLIRELYEKGEEVFVISVDGGLKATVLLNVEPHVILGDFDTVAEDLLEKFVKGSDAQIVKLNPEKDSTDTEEALNFVFENTECDEIIVLGGTGGRRLDHTYANLFLLKRALDKNVPMTFINENSKVFMINKDTVIEKDSDYKYISFLQFDGPAKGVTLEGFKYDIDDFDFDTNKTYRLGTSNEFREPQGIIKIKEGCLLVVMTKDDHWFFLDKLYKYKEYESATKSVLWYNAFVVS